MVSGFVDMGKGAVRDLNAANAEKAINNTVVDTLGGALAMSNVNAEIANVFRHTAGNAHNQADNLFHKGAVTATTGVIAMGIDSLAAVGGAIAPVILTPITMTLSFGALAVKTIGNQMVEAAR